MLKTYAILSTLVLIGSSTVFAATTSTEDYQEPSESSLILSIAGILSSQTTQNSSNGNLTSSELNLGGGVLIEANMNDRIGIETGALLVNQEYDVLFSGGRVVMQTKRLKVPVLLRIWPSDFLSFGAGPYVGFKVGDVNTTYSNSNQTLFSNQTSSDDGINWGLDTAATLNFAVADKTGIFVEGRYSILLGSESGEDANQMQALAGLKLDI